jgi:hypothetical protein
LILIKGKKISFLIFHVKSFNSSIFFSISFLGRLGFFNNSSTFFAAFSKFSLSLFFKTLGSFNNCNALFFKFDKATFNSFASFMVIFIVFSDLFHFLSNAETLRVYSPATFKFGNDVSGVIVSDTSQSILSIAFIHFKKLYSSPTKNVVSSV